MPTQLTKLPLSLIRDTRTRTNPSSSGGGGSHNHNYNSHHGGGNGILPGGGYSSSKKGGPSRKHRGPAIYLGGEYYSDASKKQRRFWSPYARPPRRSKRLVILWVVAFLLAGLFTWWVSAATRGAGEGIDGGPGGGLGSIVEEGDEMAKSYGEVLMQRPGKVPVED